MLLRGQNRICRGRRPLAFLSKLLKFESLLLITLEQHVVTSPNLGDERAAKGHDGAGDRQRRRCSMRQTLVAAVLGCSGGAGVSRVEWKGGAVARAWVL